MRETYQLKEQEFVIPIGSVPQLLSELGQAIKKGNDKADACGTMYVRNPDSSLPSGFRTAGISTAKDAITSGGEVVIWGEMVEPDGCLTAVDYAVLRAESGNAVVKTTNQGNLAIDPAPIVKVLAQYAGRS